MENIWILAILGIAVLFLFVLGIRQVLSLKKAVVLQVKQEEDKVIKKMNELRAKKRVLTADDMLAVVDSVKKRIKLPSFLRHMDINYIFGIGIALVFLGIVFTVGASLLGEISDVSDVMNSNVTTTSPYSPIVSFLPILGLVVVAGAVISIGFCMFGRLGGDI